MKNKLLRPVCALLALILLLVPMTLSVSADEGEAPEWKLAPDFSKVTYGDDVYYYCELPPQTHWVPSKSLYVYSVSADYNSNDPCILSVQTPVKGHGFIYVQTNYSNGIFVREDEFQEFQSFANGAVEYFRIAKDDNRYMQAKISKDILTALNATPNAMESVTNLKRADAYFLTAYEKTGSLCRDLGILFFFEDGRIGYVDYSKLNNSHFDADGNFSYRDGSVPILWLTGAGVVDDIKRAKNNLAEVDLDTIYEEDLQAQAIMKLIALPLFWVLFAITGAILPGVGITIGAIRAHAATPKTRKRWYVLIGMCALWLLLALIIFLMMII